MRLCLRHREEFRFAMEALIAREQAVGAKSTAAARASCASKRTAAGAASAKPGKAAKKAARPAAPPPAALDNAAESSDDQDDEELAEHGSFEPVCMADPKSAAAAEAAVGERVFIDGIAGRHDLNMSGAEIISWRAKRNRWEVECDRGDERLLVQSAHLWSLTSTQPSKPKKKKAKKADKAGAGKRR